MFSFRLVGNAIKFYRDAGNYIILEGNNSAFLQFRHGSTDLVRITSAGNVGIGTDNPDQTLHLYNSNAFASFTNDDDTGESGILFRRHDNNQNRGKVTYSFTDDALLFRASNNGSGENLRITSDGNVGIGTNNPDTLLNLFGTGNTTIKVHNNAAGAGTYSRLQLITGGSGSSARSEIRSLRMSTSTAATNLAFFTTLAGNTSPTERVRITSAGDFGIGTDNPERKLDVRGTLGISNTTDTSVRTTITSSATGLIVNHNDNSSTIFQNQGAERVRITDSGFVGIGENSPSSILHVTKSGDPNIIQENSSNNSLVRNNTHSFQFSDGQNPFVKATRPSGEPSSDTYLSFGSGGSTERLYNF